MSENENTSLVAEVLSSYLSNNSVAPADLKSVIETVKTAFGVSVGTGSTPDVEEPKKLEPAVSIKKSVTPDAIICLHCGKSFKSLKRHLQTHGSSPDAYRAAFGLKSDYPIVAPNYSAQRSSLALSAGLGRKAAEPAAAKKAGVKKPGGRNPSPKTAAE
jgi:predicted transcriptional regulator